MKKKYVALLLILAIGTACVSACGKADPVVQETSLGVNLEKKAKDVTGQQAEDSSETDEKLDEISGE